MTTEHGSITVRDPADLRSRGSDDLASVILADETVGVENVSVGIVTLAPETRGSRHVRAVEEIVVVLEGTGRIVTDDERVTITKGQAAIVPMGIHHYHENPGTSRLRKLWIFAPQGPERTIRERSGGDDA